MTTQFTGGGTSTVDALTVIGAADFGAPPTQGGVPMGRMALATAIATTSGTSHDFTGLPSWVKRITLVFDQVSTNGTAVMRVQLGAGSVQTTGYSMVGHYLTTSSGGGSSSNGFDSYADGASTTFRTGLYTFCKLSGGLWVMNGVSRSGSSQSQLVSGSVDLSGVLDRIRITTANGTDTFDNGSVNILYEG